MQKLIAFSVRFDMIKLGRIPFVLCTMAGSALALALAGCSSSLSNIQSPVVAPAARAGQITGVVHGGQSPIVGATVQLWVAGTSSGYGSGATKVGTSAPTDSNGIFNLNIGAGTVSQCTAGQFNYITSTGGDAGAGNNSYAALMLALPQPCSSTTGGLSVVVNEVTTAASVWALQQFMTINPGGSPAWQIGAPSTNLIGLQNAFLQVAQLVSISTGTSSTSTVTNTVTYPGPATTTYTTTVAPDSARLYMIADILSACVNTMDNQGNTGSAVCTNLAADVSTAQTGTAPATPTDTTQIAYDIANAPGGIVIAPVNGATTGAVLTNAAKSLTVPAAPQSIAWAYYLCNQYVGAVQPFVTSACATGSSSTTAYPADFTIGVRWSALDGAGNPYGDRSGIAAVDSVGNVWTLAFEQASSGPSITVPVTEWDPTGRVVQTVSGTVTVPASNLNVYETTTANVPSATATPISTPAIPVTLPPYIENTSTLLTNLLAIDTNNNAWFTDFGGSSSSSPADIGSSSAGNGFFEGLLVEATPATIAPCSPLPCTTGTSTAGTVSGYITGAFPGAIAIDGANNIWVIANGVANSSSGSNLMFQTAASGYLNLYEGQYFSANSFHGVAVDGQNHDAWGFLKTTTAGKAVYRTNPGVQDSTANLTSLNITGANYTSSPALVTTYGTVDKLGNVWTGEGNTNLGSLAFFNVAAAGLTSTGGALPLADLTDTTSTTNTGGTIAENTFAGLDSPTSMSIDGSNNVWVGNGVTSTTSGISLLTNSSGTNIALSPDLNVDGSYGFNTYTTDAPTAMAIDPSGNIYIGSGRNSYSVHTVGAAAPVVTPLSVNSGKGAIAAITGWSIDATGAIGTFLTSTPPAVGSSVVLYGFGTSTFFNGQLITVSAVTAGTSFSATVTGGTANASATEAGSGSYIPLNNGKIGTRP